MITQMTNLPGNTVGFRAEGEVTKQDFERIVFPAVEALVAKTDQLNYLLVLDTSVKNFTLGAWLKDALLGIQNLTKWNRAAIVSDSDGVKIFTDAFSVLVPGEFKGFSHAQLREAIDWVSDQVSVVS